MSFKLHVHGQANAISEPILGRITTHTLPPDKRSDSVLLSQQSPEDVSGYAAVLLSRGAELPAGAAATPSIAQLAYSDHLADGDIVVMQRSGYVRTLYKHGSDHNAIFATDRCNSFCLMCSQPPKAADDRERIHEHLRLVELIAPSPPASLGITGGEPTLLGRNLIRLITACRVLLNETSLHVLTNGRLFYYDSFCRELAAVRHPRLVLGIPVYSDTDYEHDFVVQARGAFDETVVGLHNLAQRGIAIELRVVVHRLTYRRLPQLAEFIYRNLTFADHVAFMGLEIIGFTVPNLSALWIDPHDYRNELEEATLYLASRGMNVSIYNHQLCVVPRTLWPYTRRSISDWKNDYLPQCDGCVAREACGGFFSWSLNGKHSSHIAPIA
ncbi:MAG TPA: His-Xaa-Ser system radical SAM maturase HxsC [Thermoanaerobaculia bacterium]|nr:His-Xaa-Ser system radical SAM maturase HxsC [Thermoanaerobaculia bacterium]